MNALCLRQLAFGVCEKEKQKKKKIEMKTGWRLKKKRQEKKQVGEW